MSTTTKDLPRAAKIERISRWLEVHKGLGISMMDHLYNKLDGMYPGQWAEKFKNEASIQNWRETWADQFEADSIAPGHIKQGLVECSRRYKYPPNVHEFVDACKGAIAPAMHRDMQPAIERKPTPEERANAAKYLAMAKELLSKKKV